MSRISPILLLVIVILAAIFFAFGLIHLLIRYLMKRPSFSSISQSNRNQETLGPHIFQRQLQQLFLLHDSGLDQSLIETLPIFYYKDIIMGLKEPFDCAVCLCEFSDKDMLRLLPLCGHAFHIHCIDTWLLSNSTCPLCRNLISSGATIPLGNPFSQFNESRENGNQNDGIMQGNGCEIRVFSIRLGKFRNINEEEDENGDRNQEQEQDGISSSSCNLDGRRCYSMGTFQYVVGSELQLALPNANMKGANFASHNNTTEKDGKKISAKTRGESYSVSKIWLWSKKDTATTTSSLDTNNNVTSSLNVGRPILGTTQLV
ncbi:hypothetical protein M9H77_04718 [Catharanthus roseus]|uniref:Uncharacterized protein n=1 Tax=Catharanthus roseus TaxID=4058 RepID=A0ACC0CF21_CATRO|nr:hypothetical protein M9H77_04718 [Catharanthus roseus]